eukprot:scaffold5925_cov122-Isochrysis_galbana.AAC.4
MGARLVPAGARRRVALASAALLEAWGRDLEARERLAARLAADEGGSRPPSPSMELGVPVGAEMRHGRATCSGWRAAEGTVQRQRRETRQTTGKPELKQNFTEPPIKNGVGIRGPAAGRRFAADEGGRGGT